MTFEELSDKIVLECIAYIKEHRKLRLKDVFKRASLEIAYMLVSANKTNIAAAAKVLGEQRSTLSERMRLNPPISDEKLKFLCNKYGVGFMVRKKRKVWD